MFFIGRFNEGKDAIDASVTSYVLNNKAVTLLVFCNTKRYMYNEIVRERSPLYTLNKNI
jgi:sugar phosphate permease